ncbi:MAG: hypothetical protein A3H67_01800 [Candidatus Buchananbacteria bacterium RIFCSPLOWO2_02_FULL_46_11b]|uniref:Uncharacterized protein n=1 Tax=Candidatus Buchananbacteria bacterium RIFCSPLOWO2_02_FULL_46_11b TaxID=1797548 RepID=A0A1G1YZ47_9BACT|nr:MAG: hypothetical protein A3H67_01800 [Candidatus Buchananbacteria bacterium RIFCSPLOWO2_02_FULL_46_11b]
MNFGFYEKIKAAEIQFLAKTPESAGLSIAVGHRLGKSFFVEHDDPLRPITLGQLIAFNNKG